MVKNVIEEETRDVFAKNKKRQYLLIIVLGISLVSFYGYHISSMHALWELGDEAGYLWNAAYFTGTDWDSYAGAYDYYGFGYSILLVPWFWFTQNGIQLVRGSYITNVICILGMYLIIIKLLKELSTQPYFLGIPAIAFISCFMPYTVSNVPKVLCETFLSFWYSLLVLLLCMAVKRKKKKYAILLGICGAFIFFIHTRAIVIVGVLVLIVFFNVVREKNYIKPFFLTIIALLGMFLILYLIKFQIINYKSVVRKSAGTDAEIGNIITWDALSTTVQWLTPVGCLGGFITKILYTMYATGVILAPGFLCMGKRLRVFLKSRGNNVKECEIPIVEGFVSISYIFMVVATVLMGTGSNLRYVIYGRYYEFMFPVLLSVCIYLFVEDKKRISTKEMVVCLVFVLLIGIGARSWCVSSLPDQSMVIDTNRMAAISKAITDHEDLGTLIDWLTLVCAAYMISYIITYKKKYAQWIFLVMIAISLQPNDSVCLSEIHNIHEQTIEDTQIAQYLIENTDLQKIYMIDDNSFRYPFYYSKMQIYLKDKKLYVIKPEQIMEIEEGSFVLAYSNTELKDTVLLDFHLLMQGPAFILYRK